MRRFVLIAALVVGVVALVPGVATASEVRSFELPSALVDTSTPGGVLPGKRTVPKVNVLLPDGYNPRSKRGYPVLWMLHGANGGTDNWVGANVNITKLAPDFPGIIVMPDGGMFGMYMDWWNGGRRGDPAWTSYHLQVFKREIEKRFRIRAGRRWHAIGGISMGGQGTLRYAAMLPGYFGTAVGFSAALPDAQSPEIQFGIAALPAANGATGVSYDAIFGPPDGPYAEGNSPLALAPNYGHTRMYLTSGNGVNCPGDPMTSSFAADVITEAAINGQQEPFANAARAGGADVTTKTTCGVHTFGVWDRAIPEALRWGMFKPVPEKPTRWTYRTIAARGDMWGLRFRFSMPPSEVATFERSGRTLKATGTGTVRILAKGGCRLNARLPFERRLSRACVRATS